MSTLPPPLRIAIVQQPMAWTTAENVEHILAALALAAGQGARIAVFPELALTGFHRGIREQALPELVSPAVQRVRAACAAHQIACMLGTPTFADDGAFLNSYVFVDATGQLASTVSKNGLTPAELTFFQPGIGRPLMHFDGRACTTVMCREIEDLDQIAGQLQGDPAELIFWPSLVGHPPGTVAEPELAEQDLGYLRRTAVLARRLNAFVVQSNWPHALNTPDHDHLGESKAYAPDGEVLLTLPRAQAGVGVFNLGDHDFHWTALPA
jgi:predicted amidohydrolase